MVFLKPALALYPGRIYVRRASGVGAGRDFFVKRPAPMVITSARPHLSVQGEKIPSVIVCNKINNLAKASWKTVHARQR